RGRPKLSSTPSLSSAHRCDRENGAAGNVDAHHHLKQLAGGMTWDPHSGGRHTINLAWIGLCVGNELGNRLAGTDGLTSVTRGTRMMPATGPMSRMKLKLRLP